MSTVTRARTVRHRLALAARRHTGMVAFAAVVGPGVLAGLSDDDPAGITSIAGSLLSGNSSGKLAFPFRPGPPLGDRSPSDEHDSSQALPTQRIGQTPRRVSRWMKNRT